MTAQTFPDGANHHRYDVRSERGEWLATVFIGADGVFSTVSDYGNYGHYWGSPSCDIRAFLCRVDEHYFVGKLSPRLETDSDATEAEIKRAIIRLRRDGILDADQAREEWELLYWIRDGNECGWWAQTSLGEYTFPADLICMRRSPQAVLFVERVMPRLVLMLRAELAAEKAAV